MGSYLNIKLVTVPNIYPMGWERLLVEETLHIKYDRLPIEKGVVVSNISTIYAIYEALKYEKPLIERVITFTGEGFKEPKNILVKVGTKVSDVINDIIHYKEDDLLFIAGGPMMGEALPTDDLVVSPNLNCVLVIKDNIKDLETNCLRCGKCVAVCPAKISPVLIKDAIKNKEYLKELEVNRCIECGLCSYICPAKIKVREIVKSAKKKIKE